MTNIKKMGRVYTPEYIVDSMLLLSEYNGVEILKKHVIDNSCGDGAFLRRVVKVFCDTFVKENDDLNDLRVALETFIHGIEIDVGEHKKCLFNLDRIVLKYGVKNVSWDILCADALLVNKFDGLMDFVVGNPPYVRIHNLDSHFKTIAKEMTFSKNGMTDLYIIFYELGIKMLNHTGKLIYITPSSIFNNLAGKYFRNFVINEKLLTHIVDFEHTKLFNVSTYSSILILDKRNVSAFIKYYRYNRETKKYFLVEKLNYGTFFGENAFFLGEKNQLEIFERIKKRKDSDKITVKNGFATLADKVFIIDAKTTLEKVFLIPVIKASTGEKKMCFFPYLDGEAMNEKELKKKPLTFNYLKKHKTKLLERSLEKNKDWFLFGRSQGIKDVYKDKLVINTTIRDQTDLKLSIAPSGTGVYSGLYIISDFSLDALKQYIIENDFIGYVKTLSKYKSGGYYTFSSKDLKRFLNGFDDDDRRTRDDDVKDWG